MRLRRRVGGLAAWAAAGSGILFMASCLFFGALADDIASKSALKVRAIDVHPVRRWIVAANEHELAIWDYQNRTVIKRVTPQEDEERRIELLSSQRSLAEIGVLVDFGTPSRPFGVSSCAPIPRSKKEKKEKRERALSLGLIREVKFFDQVQPSIPLF